MDSPCDELVQTHEGVLGASRKGGVVGGDRKVL